MTNPIPTLLTNCLVLFAIYYFITPPPALGYFDLGTGTYMLQMILGFGAAVWLSLRTSFIRYGRNKKKPVADNAVTAAEADAQPADPGDAGVAKSES